MAGRLSQSNRRRNVMLNFTKQEEFLDTLKNPQNTRIREGIKKLRECLSDLNWKVSSRFNKSTCVFTVQVRNHQAVKPELVPGPGQAYAEIYHHFPSSISKISVRQKSSNHLIFWITKPE